MAVEHFFGIFVIFRTHIMGDKSHNLCCVLFSKSCQISTLLLHLVEKFSSHHDALGSESACQTRGRGVKPLLMRSIFSGKNPGA